MVGMYLTPPKTMITYLGLKQTDTAFIGEVHIFQKQRDSVLSSLVLMSNRMKHL